MKGPAPWRYPLYNLWPSPVSIAVGLLVPITAGVFAAADDFGNVSASSVDGKAFTPMSQGIRRWRKPGANLECLTKISHLSLLTCNVIESKGERLWPGDRGKWMGGRGRRGLPEYHRYRINPAA